MLQKITVFLFLTIITASPAFAGQSFNVTGSGDSNDSTCGCSNQFGCGCYQDRVVQGRCSFPSGSIVSKLLKQQIEHRLIVDEKCSNVRVNVSVKQTNGSSSLLNGAGKVSFDQASNNPYAIRVTSINIGCSIQVPVTVTVSAKDAFGNSIRQRYVSTPVVQGVFK